MMGFFRYHLQFRDLKTFISTHRKGHVQHFLKIRACKFRGQSDLTFRIPPDQITPAM